MVCIWADLFNPLSPPPFLESQSEGDLLQEEVDDFWQSAPKFPAVEGGPDRIDVDGFVQLYRDIDDIFEDEDDEEAAPPAPAQSMDVDVKAEDPVVAGDEAELEVAFKRLCDDSTGLVSKEMLRAWDEIESLVADGMLGVEEFETIWEQTAKKPGSDNEIDIEGFLSFNVALDDLFVFDDEELEDGVGDATDDDDGNGDDGSVNESNGPTESKPMVEGDDLSPEQIFAAIADDDFLVGMAELERWGELQDMLADEELLPIELQNLFSEAPKAPGTKDKLDERAFISLYSAIDELFEDDDGDDNGEVQSIQDNGSTKLELLEYIADLTSDPDLLPCGLECTEREQERILDIVADLEEQRSNMVILQGGDIQPEDLTGDWKLIFTTSSTMQFNKGLSGLGGSFPNGKFGGVVQKLKATKYTSDIEYKERIDVPAGASFDVTVNGDWKLKGTVNIFTGEPTTVMAVEPDKVEYGPTSTKADHWKSLGPLNLLDITYLDEDLRVMRGNTSVNTIFIFQRCQ